MDEENDWLEFIKMPNIYKLNFEEGYCDDISKFSETVSELYQTYSTNNKYVLKGYIQNL